MRRTLRAAIGLLVIGLGTPSLAGTLSSPPLISLGSITCSVTNLGNREITVTRSVLDAVANDLLVPLEITIPPGHTDTVSASLGGGLRRCQIEGSFGRRRVAITACTQNLSGDFTCASVP